MPTQCDEIAVLLPDAVDAAEPVALPVRRHIESCLRCQAELARYRRMLRGLQLLRTQYFEPTPGLLAQTLASITAASERRAVTLHAHEAPHRLRRCGGGRGRRRRHHHRGRARRPGPAPHAPRLTRSTLHRRRLRPKSGRGRCYPLCFGPPGPTTPAEPALRPVPEGSSSIGRAPVSKTGGWGFESLLPCSTGTIEIRAPARNVEIAVPRSEFRVNRQTKRLMAKQGADKPRAPERRQQPQQQTTKEKTGPRQYLSEVRGELKKVAWPTKKEVTNSTIVVLIAVVFMTTLIFLLDYGSSKFVLFLFD